MILLALFRNKDKYGVKPIIKCLLTIAIRYNYICQRQTNKQETIYNSVAQKIQNRLYNQTSEIVNELYSSDVYLTDNEFISEFSKKNFASERIDRYILARIQEFYNESSPINYDSMTIEHIEDKSTKKEYVNLIGNQTILTKTENNNLSGKTYIEKKHFMKVIRVKLCIKYQNLIAGIVLLWLIDPRSLPILRVKYFLLNIKSNTNLKVKRDQTRLNSFVNLGFQKIV